MTSPLGCRLLAVISIVLGLAAASGAAALPVSSVESGQDHACAVMEDATVMCWGANDDGQLGDGTRTDRNSAVRVAGLGDVVGVAPSRAHTCAVQSTGLVKCWGSGQFGQLGDGVTRGFVPSLSPVTVSGVTTATEIASGSETTCALLMDTTVRCWGRGDYGTRGDGSATNIQRTPGAVSGLSGVGRIIGGRLHMCALMTDQSLRCWGSNFYGELGDGTQTRSLTPKTVPLPGAVISADAGASGTCAALVSGTAYCWGANDDGQLGLGSTGGIEMSPMPVSGISTALEIGLGGQAGCARAAGATVTCWGHGVWNGGVGGTGTPLAVPGLKGASALAVGRSVACAVMGSPSVKCWGSNSGGSVGGDFWGTGDINPVVVLGFTATPSVTGRPTSPLGSATATFAMAGSAAASYQCMVDGGAYTACGSPPTVTGLADGDRSVRIRAIDVAGNPSMPAPAVAITVDISAAPPGLVPSIGALTNQTSATFVLSGEAGAGFECALDGRGYTPCPPRFPVSGLTEGDHTFRARQVSVLGHVSQPSAFRWVVDVTPPRRPVIRERPLVDSPTASATFAFPGDAGASFACALDRAGEVACSSPHTVGGLPDGAHTMAITQIDPAGNRSEPATVAWNVDTVAPPPPRFTRAPVMFSLDPGELIVLAGEAGASFICSRDDGLEVTCPRRQTVGNLPMGRHSITAWQVDAAGNRSAPAATRWITVPTPPPGEVGVSISDAAIYVNQPDVVLHLVWPEGATHARISNDGGFKNAETHELAPRISWTLSSSGAERLPTTIYVRFRGWRVDETKTFTDDVILDETPPEIISVAVAPATGSDANAPGPGRVVMVRVRARDRTSGVRDIQIASARAPGAKVLPFRAAVRTMVTGARVWVRVRDGAGHWSRWKAAYL